MSSSGAAITSTYAERMADYFVGLRYEDIPVDVLRKTKLLMLDALGCAIAATPTEWGQATTAVAAEMGGTGPSSVIGSLLRLTPANAALANGCLIHGLDYDDTYFIAMLHPSCCMLPALFAVGEAEGVTGKALLTAAVAGYEGILRIVRAGLDNLFHRNYHTAGLLAPLGAGLASAKLMRFDATRTADTLGIAGSLGGGVLQTLIDGNNVKALRPGYGAHGGVLAARLAAHGVTGPHQIFEGELGLYKTMLGDGQYDLARLVDDLGKAWHVLDVSVKMFPGGHRHHFFVEAIRHLKGVHGFSPGDIESICCISAPEKFFYNFSEVGYAPPNSYIAGFSVPYLIATALLRGRVTAESFVPSAIRDPETLRLARKVTYEVQEGADRPENRGHVIVRMKDGRILQHKQKYILGVPEQPASEADIFEKFRTNCARLIPAQQIDALIDGIEGLEEMDSLTALLARTAVDKA